MSAPRQPTEAELAALADGSLSPQRRERLLEQVRASPELSAALTVQQRAVAMTRPVEVQAPDLLHRRIATLRGASLQRRDPRPRLVLGGALSIAVAAVAAVLVIALNGGSHHSLDLARISALTFAPATMSAPSESTTRDTQLAVSVRGVPFPYWSERFGWHSTGMRNDRIAGHVITTVFYADSSGRRIGYAILAATTAPRIPGGVIAWRDGVSYRLLSEKGASVVTWLRDGHLCVVSGHDVPSATLLRLASWSDRATAS